MTITIWLLTFTFIIPPMLFPDFGAYMLPDMLDTRLTRLMISFIPALLLLWIWFKTGYTVEEDIIKIEYGPIKRTVNIKEIRSIRGTRNPFIDPALSMDKLEINYARFHTIAIAPKNKDEFVRQLLKQNPNIQINNRLKSINES